MFKALRLEECILGYTLETDRHFYFFGSRHARREDLPKLFPHFQFCFLKQVHGRSCVEAVLQGEPEADAHFTNVPGRALVAQSADCMPLLMSGQKSICAIHAGWRGLAQDILQAVSLRIPPPDFVSIGPHIGPASFEVGEDVAASLRGAAPDPASLFHRPGVVAPGKVFFDLKALANAQLRAHFGANLQIVDCCEDTKANAMFHSFRRDREKAGRQYSFVAIRDR